MPRRAITPVTREPATAPGGVTSVDRALSLLQAFTVAAPTRTLSELAEHTHQYKSTVLRMMASLEHADLVRRHADGRFTLGPAVARLNAVHSSSFSLGDVVQPVLVDLVAATRESAAFHVQQGEQDLCLYRIDSPQPVRDHLHAGDVQPLARSAAGRVMLAYAGANSVDGAKGRASSRAARVRREQMLVADGDIVPELAAIAAPVFSPDGSLAGVLQVTMPSVRFQPTVAPRVAAAARQITTRIGGFYPEPAPAGVNTKRQSR
jgi:DNA-binding IclR family transcriptional regulator